VAAFALLFRTSAALVEIHAVAASLFVLDHLKIICRQTKRLQYTITKLVKLSIWLTRES
jgi:hypothetical protein